MEWIVEQYSFYLPYPPQLHTKNTFLHTDICMNRYTHIESTFRRKAFDVFDWMYECSMSVSVKKHEMPRIDRWKHSSNSDNMRHREAFFFFFLVDLFFFPPKLTANGQLKAVRTFLKFCVQKTTIR